MRLLVLGGTSFVGRAIVVDALARGHAVTTVNRGRTGPDVPGVEAVRGDRRTADGLAGVVGRAFDAAVDPGGLVPAQVLRSVRALAPTVAHYAYVSSVSVYPHWRSTPVDETSPVHAGDKTEDATDALSRYGERKAGCELAVADGYPADRRLIVRPGTVVGPGDNIGQTLWWLRRLARGGPVAAPGDPDRALQLLDVRDLAAFVLDALERRRVGVLNAVPDGPNTTMGGLLGATGAADLHWVDEPTLAAHGVRPWWELPLWLPDTPANAGAWATSGAAAAAAGLRCRSVAETLEDTARWLVDGGRPYPARGAERVGITPAREARLLAAAGVRTAV